MRAIVHTTTPEDTLTAVEVGAALLVHVPQRGVLTPSEVSRIVAADVPLVTTARLISASHQLAREGPIALEREMHGPALLEPWLASPLWDLEGFSEEIDEPATREQAVRDTAANVRRLREGGARLLVGTDSGVHGVFPGSSLHREMRYLVELGLTPVDVLRAATSEPADFIDPEARFGRVAPGYRADLLLVQGDPTDTIDALSEIEGVWLAGARLQREPVD